MSALRILQLCPDYDPHIVGLYQRTADALQVAGHSVTTAFLTGIHKPTLADEFGSPTHFFDLAPSPLSHVPRSWILTLAGHCQAQDIDVLIAQRHRACAVAARAWRHNSPALKIVVYHGLGQFRRWRRRLFARAYLRGWTVVAVSEAVRRDLLASGACFRADQVVTLPNAIDVARVQAGQFDQASARRALGIAPQAFVFGTVGRLSLNKGQRFLIEAFASLADRFPDSRLAILGGGRLEPELKRLAERHAVTSRVYLLGHVPEAHRYLRALDVFVLPSLVESFGLVLLEAMATKLPIVATRTDGAREVLGETAELVPGADAVALTNAMERIYRTADRDRRTPGDQSYRRVRERFDLPQYYGAYQELVLKAKQAYNNGDAKSDSRRQDLPSRSTRPSTDGAA